MPDKDSKRVNSFTFSFIVDKLAAVGNTAATDAPTLEFPYSKSCLTSLHKKENYYQPKRHGVDDV